MTYLTRAVLTGILVSVVMWLGVGFVAGSLNMMELPASARFGMLVFWLFSQGVNGISWACAYEDSVKDENYR